MNIPKGFKPRKNSITEKYYDDLNLTRITDEKDLSFTHPKSILEQNDFPLQRKELSELNRTNFR